MGQVIQLDPTTEIMQQKVQAEAINQELDVLRKLGVIETFTFVGTQTEGDDAFIKHAQENFGNMSVDKVPDFLFKGLDGKIAADGQTDAYREKLREDSGHSSER